MELIKSYLSGNVRDFDELYERHKKLLYGYLHNMLPRQHAVVDDIFQQTWLKALRKLPEYRCSNHFSAWLVRIGHNLAIDHFRRNKKLASQLSLDCEEAPTLPDTSKPAWTEMDQTAFETALSAALETLQTEQREVFLLRHEKISFKEIAELQNCSINTALARMQYATKNLKRILTAWKDGGCTI